MSYKKIFEDLQSAFKTDPEKAKAEFQASSKLVSGLKCESQSRNFRTIIDEPEALRGSDEGPARWTRTCNF